MEDFDSAGFGRLSSIAKAIFFEEFDTVNVPFFPRQNPLTPQAEIDPPRPVVSPRCDPKWLNFAGFRILTVAAPGPIG
ncbi:hypothetical protein GGD81_003541 [Rhodobium orientis]|uniref:hypothetical protein n=1 Tax=Rhodobium orientis TaxID=34017 RepID=UPI0011B93C07|nr:hypothetical protein [Rhodobium orientis]MBB4304482.1 hypothetical protein [Rhodobium orientis]